jgi:hypothetical protein
MHVRLGIRADKDNGPWRWITAAPSRALGTQVGTYRPGAPNGMIVEMTYLEPDAEHPRGQALDGAGKPVPLH